VAIDGGQVVGMASGVHYVHPDKPAQMFINEVGVAPTHRRVGLARRLIEALLARARELQCIEAWVATDADNELARALYQSVGGKEQTPPCVIFEFGLNET
jgi:ribosomal protein S18 acetylase RimI-like enzyme